MRLAPGRTEVVVCAPGVVLELRRIGDGDHCDVVLPFPRQPRQHVAIAAVVAWSADDDQSLCERPAAAHRRQRRRSGPRHQRVRRDLEDLDRMAVQRPHLGGAMDGERQGNHDDRLSKQPRDSRRLALVYSAPPEALHSSTP